MNLNSLGAYYNIYSDFVSLKISFFVWCLLHHRIPTMDNLIIKQILQSNVHLYVDGCGKHEDISTLFGFTVVLPARVSDHISQFGNLGGFSRSIRTTLHLSWLSCAWVIWREKNARFFQHQEDSLQNLIDKIKLQCYWWLKVNHTNFAFDYHMWWLNPFSC